MRTAIRWFVATVLTALLSGAALDAERSGLVIRGFSRTGTQKPAAILISIVYSVPVDLVWRRIRILILNAILLNVLVGAGLFTLARMYERQFSFRRRRESVLSARREHEQFNRKNRCLPRRWGSVFCAHY